MRVIYIDILLLLNFYTSYFLITGASCLLHRKILFRRRILAASAGALTSLAIFLPPLPLLLNILLKLAASTVIVLSAWGFGGIKSFVKNTALFFLISCLYAGVMLGLWLFVCPEGMMYNNGVGYLDMPLWIALAATALAYFIIRIFRRLLDGKNALDKKYVMEITAEKGAVTLSAAPDSGNKLTDFFTGLPVIFCSLEKCRGICPNEVLAQLETETADPTAIKGVRLIPCTTVSGAAMAVCFKPQSIVIEGKEVEALIGFTKSGLGDTEAIFNPSIL